jgi:ABC-type transport system substrate-binding protein
MSDGATILLARQIFETPFLVSPDGSARPCLFSDPLVEDPESGGTRFSGRVRPDARFSDGTLVTPADMVAALAGDPVFRTRGTATLRDDLIQINLFAPDTRFDLFLTMCGFLVREDQGLQGTGPYMLESAATGVVRLVRNPHARTTAPIESLEVRAYPADPETGRPTALLAALEKGEVDLAPRLSWRDVHTLRNTAVVLKPVSSTCILYLNNERLSDPRQRAALALALDRTEIAERAFGDNPLAFRATGLLPPALGKTLDRLSPDVERARVEWRDVAKSSEPLTIVYSPGARPYLPAPAAVARLVRDRLRRIGATVETVELPPAQLSLRLNAGSFDLALMGNIPDSPDPADYLAAVVGSDAVPENVRGTFFAFNFSRYRSREVDDLIAAYRKERREETLGEIGVLLGRDVPLIPLMYGRACVAHSWRLRGFKPTVTGLIDLSVLTLS